MAVTIDEVRAYALTLPRTYEALVRDRVKLRVGRIVYLAFSRDETAMGFSYPKEERAALVASDPDKFAMPSPRDERFNWVQVRLAAIDAEEMREIVTEAWRMVVPRSVAATHLGAGAASALHRPTLADLRAAADVFNGFADIDRSWHGLHEDTRPAIDLGRADHRAVLLRWLNSWGCRIRYPREGEPALFDTGIARWWDAWEGDLPSGTLAGLSDSCLAAFGRAYGELAAIPVAAGRVARSLGPTAAAKTLYALRPEAVMAWDAAIAERLHGARDADTFTRHLTLGRDWARGVLSETGAAEAALPELVGRPGIPLSKILDEYLYVRFSMKKTLR
ncbi:MmcQ/YjbR family DNA-binding protein [Streptomyces melanogenes]|uniref:MmcQ/YjbR family DNA-binding protein n=1 Tax=Streptomyces melanogenes TaxID=67326 RepID=UPI00167D44D3|nr:MmcQ/YjbR family DNA-binding protein [Streptomyces melanogenes]GGP91459.1 hypothetical protein GCM10010278_82170 [Streptomyces melanogenes]